MNMKSGSTVMEFSPIPWRITRNKRDSIRAHSIFFLRVSIVPFLAGKGTSEVFIRFHGSRRFRKSSFSALRPTLFIAPDIAVGKNSKRARKNNEKKIKKVTNPDWRFDSLTFICRKCLLSGGPAKSRRFRSSRNISGYRAEQGIHE